MTTSCESRETTGRSFCYKLSCFAYCAAGVAVLARNEWLLSFAEPCCPTFPFRLLGLSVFVNGFTSYQADVLTFGENQSLWKLADVLLACTNVVFVSALAVLNVLGPMSFPAKATSAFVAGLIASLLCKVQSTRAQKVHDKAGFIFWHTLWHAFLPFGGVLMILTLPSSVQTIH